MKKRRPHVELILQSCPEENGAAALAMVLSWFRRPAALRELTAQPMASAADLVKAAQARGIYAQGYQMTMEQLVQAPMPLIAHWKFHAFVVVTGVKGGKVYVNSPEEGRLVLSRKDFAAGFTGVTVCFAADEPESRPAAPGIARELLPRGAAVPVLLACAQLFIAAGYVVLAVLLRSVADQLSSPQTGGGLSVCLQLGLVLLLQGAAAGFQIWLVRRCRKLCRREILQDFCQRLDSQNIAFFQITAPFRLSEAAGGCAARPAAMARWALCVSQLISGGACLVVMALQNLPAAAAAAVVAAMFAWLCYRGRESLYSDEKCRSRDRFLTEDLAVRDLAAWEMNRIQGRDCARFQNWAGVAGSASRGVETERQRSLWYLAAAAEILLVFCVCLLEMIAGWAGTADLLSCLVLAAAAAASMGALPGFLAAAAAEKQARESAGEIFRGETEARASTGAQPAKVLTVQTVTVRPKTEDAISVKDISFTVRQGEILVITGEEAVRSALAAVVSGLERPVQGAVYLDSRSTGDLSDREICESITLLGGGIPFPQGTVRENIAAGFRDITDYAVMEAASDAMLHQSVLLRADGYDTPVSTLSSGERVLLEFARAFARGTPFLVCDGLTGVLDGKTEDRLIRNLRRRGIGAVLLTEDTALLPKGDIVYRIEAGRTALRERAEFVEGEVYSLV